MHSDRSITEVLEGVLDLFLFEAARTAHADGAV
jgi:hypothetical protein